MLQFFKRNIIISMIIAALFFIVVMVKNDLRDEYPLERNISYATNDNLQSVESLDLCLDNTVVYMDDKRNAELYDNCYYALLINETDKEVITSKNTYERIYPASMTKLMTGIIVCDLIEEGKISLEDEVKISNNYYLPISDAGTNELTSGCKITVKDLLYGLMIDSNNYDALILADYCAGSKEAFCDMMNKKALEIGATGTHYANPHGLDDINHYTTPYDTYLICKEANKHEILKEIDSLETYSYTYTNSEGVPIYVSIEASNLFMNDHVELPANINMQVWKTGTTRGAGNCLAMFVDCNGKDYFVLASSGESKASLYDAMVRLMCQIQ